jgi:hypothetical protein
MSYRFALLILLFSGKWATAQMEHSAFSLTGHGIATPFARDYQALGINPANLDLQPEFEGKRYTFGMMELGMSFYSGSLGREEVRQNIYQEKLAEMSQAERIDFARDFSDATHSGDVDLMTIGFAARTNKLGAFAVNVRERGDFYAKLGNTASELLWLGFAAPYFDRLVLLSGDTIDNSGDLDAAALDQVIEGIRSPGNASSLSDLLKGSVYRFSWVREINVGYGKKLIGTEKWELHGGVGVKFLLGQGLFELDATGDRARLFSSLSPVFGADYGDAVENNPSDLPSGSAPLSPVGFGVGFDLGTTLVVGERFYASAAVNDIGSIKWDGNLYELNETELETSDEEGFGSTSFVDQVTQMVGSDGLLSWQGAQAKTTQLPTSLRFGAGFRLPLVRAGIDVVMPVVDNAGSMERAVIAVGGEASPLPWLHVSTGVMQGGNYDLKVPAGIRFTPKEGVYEFGIASRDVITFFTENQPTVSMAFGFMRFRF